MQFLCRYPHGIPSMTPLLFIIFRFLDEHNYQLLYASDELKTFLSFTRSSPFFPLVPFISFPHTQYRTAHTHISNLPTRNALLGCYKTRSGVRILSVANSVAHCRDWKALQLLHYLTAVRRLHGVSFFCTSYFRVAQPRKFLTFGFH